MLTDGAQLNAGTSGNAPAGNIIINADSVTISGVNSFGSSSGLFTSTEGVSTFYGSSGKGGDIKINAGTLRVLDGAVISAKTTSDNNGGNIVINTTNLEINNGGQFLSTANSTGQAGDITINATGDVVISGSDATYAERSTRTYEIFLGSGIFKPIIIDNDDPNSGLFARVRGDKAANAGNIEVTARNLRLGNQGTITTENTFGDGGYITLNVKDILLLRNNSSITATAGTERAGGNGGNIRINAPSGFIVAAPRENSDITANAFSGNGGRVTINATGIFGIAPLSRQDLQRLSPKLDPRQVPTSDITAISQTNPSLSGTIELITPDVDPNSGLIELPTIPVDTELTQGCYSPGYAQNRFVITGRGGLAPNPKDVLSPDAVQVDWVTLKPSTRNRKSPPVTIKPTTARPKQIVEATGWVIDAKGEVQLIANAPTTTPHGSWQNPVSCRAS
ncbi:MAG: S-layer family protein [Nostoc sp. NMS9]|nr:S-layer family protein [Nostoc sp. NMS9]